jgi:hypothetical protein
MIKRIAEHNTCILCNIRDRGVITRFMQIWKLQYANSVLNSS